MTKRALFIISFAFALKMFISCKHPCEGSPAFLLVERTNAEIETARFNSSFLSFNLTFDVNKVESSSDTWSSLNYLSLGFSKSYAKTHCNVPQERKLDTISHIKVFIEDVVSNNSTEITDRLRLSTNLNSGFNMLSGYKESKINRPQTSLAISNQFAVDIPDNFELFVEIHFKKGKTLTVRRNFK